MCFQMYDYLKGIEPAPGFATMCPRLAHNFSKLTFGSRWV